MKIFRLLVATRGGVTDFSVKSGHIYQAELLRCFCGGFLNVFVFLKACYHSITLMHFGQYYCHHKMMYDLQLSRTTLSVTPYKSLVMIYLHRCINTINILDYWFKMSVYGVAFCTNTLFKKSLSCFY